ncbi:MAG: preprotein translocase subunit SecG [Gammaproteobacteria bacterium]
MYQVIIVFHVLLGLGIIGLVLMQQGKGADAGAAFGAGASGSVFGAQGAASFLSRSTAILATLFFITSLSLAVFNSHTGIAYDLMSGSEEDKEMPTLPETESDEKAEVEAAPAVEPEQASEAPPAIEKAVDSEAGENVSDKAKEAEAAPGESKKTAKPAAKE